MNIILLSEQNFSLVGGTITYMKMLIKEFDKKRHKITIIYPSSISEEYYIDEVRYIGLTVGSEWTEFLGWKYRRLFVKRVNDWLNLYLANHEIDIIHIMHGFFLLEGLNYKFLKKRNIHTAITIHNIPPREGGSSWKGDKWLYFFKNILFQYLRKILFIYRLKKSKIDYFIVPSKPVLNDLQRLLNKNQKCVAIPHGIQRKNIDKRTSIFDYKEDKCNYFLTVGGIAPHKNQLLIPEISHMLKNKNINFIWNIVGPNRNTRYASALERKIDEYKLNDCVFVKYNISDTKLEEMYYNSNLYIHLSFEEGFCFTVLDAALFGLPIIGIDNVGEIPEIIRRSNGKITDNTSSGFTEAIVSLINSDSFIVKNNTKTISDYYSWKSSVQKLENIYIKLKNS